MPVWHLEIDLAPFIREWKDGKISIEELSIKVVRKIKLTNWRTFSPYPHTWDDTIDALLQATTPGEYQAAFEPIYDLADEDRVWIITN